MFVKHTINKLVFNS